MINIYDWSCTIERNLVRITFNQPLANNIILIGNAFKAQLLTNIKSEENELYFAFKNSLTANEFVIALIEKYPNSFTLKNNWDISQIANTTVSLSCLIETNLCIMEDIILSMFDDFKNITSMTDGKISNFELNIDFSGGYMNFDILFTSPKKAKDFIQGYNKFKK